MLYYVLATSYVLACLFLLLVVLLQQGRAGDIASAFGGGGSQTVFGARTGATVLSRATTVLGTLFMVGSLLLAVMSQRGPGSVVSGVAAPAPASAPAPQPAGTAGQPAPSQPQSTTPQPSSPTQQTPQSPPK